MSFESKVAAVRNRQLSVQELCIPLKVTANATPASVLLRNDEPAVLFLRSQGVDQITVASGALESGEVATYAVAANDANGIFNLLVKVGEPIGSICSAEIIGRVTGVQQPCFLGSTSGVTSVGDKIMLTCDSTVDLSTTDLDACLVVRYVVDESK